MAPSRLYERLAQCRPEKDRRLLPTAAQAQRAADFILGTSAEPEQEEE